MNEEELAEKLSQLLEADAPEMGAMLFRKQCRNRGLDPRHISRTDCIFLIRPMIDLLRPIIGPGRSEHLHERMVDAAGLRGSLGDPDVKPGIKISILTEMAMSQSSGGMLDHSRGSFRKALRLAREKGFRDREIEILHQMGYMEADIGNYETAHSLFLDAHDAAGDELGRSQALNGVGYVNWKWGKYSEAERIFREGIRSMKGMGEDRDVELLGRLHTNLANVLDETGREDEAVKEYLNGIGYLKEAKCAPELTKAHNNLGDLKLKQGLYDEAVAQFMLSRQMGERIGDVMAVAWADFNLAEAYIRADILEKAFYLLERAKRVLGRAQNRQARAALYRNYGMYYGAVNNEVDSDRAFRDSLAIYDELDLPYSHAVTHLEYARILLKQGRTELAAANAHEASAIFSDLGLIEEASAALEVL